MLSIVIPYRNETMLAFTVGRLQETVNVPHEIITVDDGSDKHVEIPPGVKNIRLPKHAGVDVARHTGLEAAAHDAVLLLDAHMNFWEDDWAEQLVDSIRNNPTHIGCAISVRLTPEQMDMASANGQEAGAHIQAKNINDTPDLHPAMKRNIFAPVWNSGGAPGEIACILGGAYLISKRWYMEVLRAPWQHLRGWGISEPLISVVNYLMGGTNVCLNIEIGHMYRTGRFDLVPYASYIHNILYNQIYMAFLVVTTPEETNDLIAHLALADSVETHSAWQLLKRSNYPKYRSYLIENGSRTWTDYKEQWMKL